MATVFRGIIEFFGRLGIYDVVLPFLLVFTIVFAVFEKTKIFGMEKIGKEEYTRKNLNSMVAFVIAFFVVASARLVAVINEALAHVVLLLLVSISFLLLIGSFFSHKEEAFLKEGAWRTTFMIFMLVGVLLIFLNALDWLNPGYNWLANHWDSTAAGSVALMAVIIGFMYFIVREPSRGSNKTD